MQMRREIFARIEKSYDQTVMTGFVLLHSVLIQKPKTKNSRRQLGFV